jgi:hypothetical protein
MENSSSTKSSMKKITKVLNNGSNMFSTKNIVIAVLVILLILSFLGINILVYVGILLENIVKFIRPLFDNILGFIFYYMGAVINVGADVTGDVARTSIDIAEGTIHSVGNLLQNEDNVNGPLPEQTAFYQKIFASTPLDEQETVYSESRKDYAPVYDDAGEIWKTTADMAEMIMSEASVPIDIQVSEPPMAPTVSPSPSTQDLDKAIEKEKRPTISEPEPLPSWCLAGEFGGKRSCVSMEPHEVCESGQIYDNESNCLQLGTANAKSVTTVLPPKEPVVIKKKSIKALSPAPKPVIMRPNHGIAPPIPPRAAYSPPMGNYLPQQGYVQTQPVKSTLTNPYYAADKYRADGQLHYMGPNPGLYLQSLNP